MTADELRLRLAGLIRRELGAHVTVQGKRLVVEDEDEDTTIILVTAGRVLDVTVSRRENHAP